MLNRSLHVELTDLAKALQRHGRGKDSVLAHITPKEAALLKARGGRGSTNPTTGLLEFDDSLDLSPVNVTPSNFNPAPDVNVNPVAPPVENVTVTAPPPQSPLSSFSFLPTTGATPSAQAPTVAQAPAAPAVQAPTPQTVAPSALQTNQNPVVNAPPPNIGTAPQTPDQSANDQATDWLHNNKTLLELGGLGALGLYGGINSANAAKQAGQLQSNLAGLAQPTLAQGNAALNAVQTGALTPANEQALQAVQAQTAAGQRSGAVSAQQAAQAISGTFATLLNNQLNQALQLLNTADSYLQTAYLQGYQANVANQQNTQSFYSNLAQLAARMAGVGGGTTVVLPNG